MRHRAPTFALVMTALAAAAAFVSYRPLSRQRMDEQLGPDPDLVFVFETGVDDPEVRCGPQGALPRDGPETETAIATNVGWLSRSCDHDRVVRRLTPDGKRLSSQWSKSPEVAVVGRKSEDRDQQTTWFVTAARFERIGQPEALPTPYRTRKRVIVHGRWLTTRDGQTLARSGWGPPPGPALREEEFELRLGGWHRIPNSNGRDLSGL